MISKDTFVLYRRPRLLNPLHALGLANAHSQMIGEELCCLGRYAKGHKVAIEIGSYMGVSATEIARALSTGGRLFCVDPWEERKGKENPCWKICRRELHRNGVSLRVIFLRGRSKDMERAMPENCDFMFIDGDHSYEGLQTDWGIVKRHLVKDGTVCLHDTSVPTLEPHRKHGSVSFFNEVIRRDPDFEWLECCYSMNVLKRIN